MNAQPSVARRDGQIVIAWTADDDASLLTNQDRHIVTASRSSGGTWTTPALAAGLPAGADTPSLALWPEDRATIAFLVRGTDGDGVTPTGVISDQARVFTANAKKPDGPWDANPVVEGNGEEARGERPLVAANGASSEGLLVYRRFGDHTSGTPAEDTFGHIVMTQISADTPLVPAPTPLTRGTRQRWLQTLAIDPTTGRATVVGVDIPDSRTPSAEDDTLVTRTVEPDADPALEQLVTVPAHADPGSPVEVRVTARNLGRARASGLMVDFFAGTPGTGTLLATMEVPASSLGFNESAEVTNALTAGSGPQPIYAVVRSGFGGNADPSNDIAIGSLRKLSPPTRLMVSPAADADRALDLSWLAPPEDGTTGYRVLRTLSGASEAYLAGESELNHFRDRFVTPAATYCYTVTAYDETGLFSPPSEPSCATVASTSPFGVALSGVKLKLTDDPDDPFRRRVVAISKDPAIAIDVEGGSGDPIVHGAALRLGSAAGNSFDGVYELPATGWQYIGPAGGRTGYRYRAPLVAPGIPVSAIRSVIVKRGKLLKITGKGAALTIDLTEEPVPVDLRLTLGDRLVCLRFGGDTRFADGKALLATSAPAPRKCPISAAEN